MSRIVTLVRANGKLTGAEEGHKGTYTSFSFTGIFTINTYYVYGFKMLILVTESRTKHSQSIGKTPIILLSELIIPIIFLSSSFKRALCVKGYKINNISPLLFLSSFS